MRVDTERLVAALLASHSNLKLDYHAIARMYGQGAKYNTMEHKFRAYRKSAEKMRAEADGDQSSAPTPRTPRAARAPRTPRTGSKTTASSKKGSGVKSNKANIDVDTDTEIVHKTSITIDVDSDDLSPIKPEIKEDNAEIRGLMGIRKHLLDDTSQSDEESASTKRSKVLRTGFQKTKLFNSKDNGYANPQVGGSDTGRKGSIADVTASNLDNMLHKDGLYDGASYIYEEA